MCKTFSITYDFPIVKSIIDSKFTLKEKKMQHKQILNDDGIFYMSWANWQKLKKGILDNLYKNSVYAISERDLKNRT